MQLSLLCFVIWYFIPFCLNPSLFALFNLISGPLREEGYNGHLHTSSPVLYHSSCKKHPWPCVFQWATNNHAKPFSDLGNTVQYKLIRLKKGSHKEYKLYLAVRLNGLLLRNLANYVSLYFCCTIEDSPVIREYNWDIEEIVYHLCSISFLSCNASLARQRLSSKVRTTEKAK